MLHNSDSKLTAYLDVLARDVYPTLKFPVSREHYVQRCWPVIERILNTDRRLTVLDAGCGHAYEAILFSALGADVIGIDLREDGFKVARQNVEKFKSLFPSINVELINRDVFAAMKAFNPDVVWVRQAISHIHPAEDFIHLAYDQLNPNGILVINDSNAMNPLVLLEVAGEHWRGKRTLRWFVTDKYRDPVTNEVVPYAVERTQRAMRIKKTLQNCGFQIEAVDMTGFIPVTVAAKIPHITPRLESIIRKLPWLSQFGADYTVCGRKCN